MIDPEDMENWLDVLELDVTEAKRLGDHLVDRMEKVEIRITELERRMEATEEYIDRMLGLMEARLQAPVMTSGADAA